MSSRSADCRAAFFIAGTERTPSKKKPSRLTTVGNAVRGWAGLPASNPDARGVRFLPLKAWRCAAPNNSPVMRFTSADEAVLRCIYAVIAGRVAMSNVKTTSKISHLGRFECRFPQTSLSGRARHPATSSQNFKQRRV